MPEPPYFPDEDLVAAQANSAMAKPEFGRTAQAIELITQRDSAAGWLQAIAGFSVINLIVLVFGLGINFLIGLAVTQFLHVISLAIITKANPEAKMLGWAVSIVGTLAIAGLFLLLGTLAKKGYIVAFILGMMLYAADGLLYLLIQDWFSAGFHAFVLFMLAQGLKAQWKLDQLRRAEEFGPRGGQF